MSTAPSRQPPGITAGGQFRNTDHPEGDATLDGTNTADEAWKYVERCGQTMTSLGLRPVKITGMSGDYPTVKYDIRGDEWVSKRDPDDATYVQFDRDGETLDSIGIAERYQLDADEIMDQSFEFDGAIEEAMDLTGFEAAAAAF